MSVRKIRNSWWVDFRYAGERRRIRSPLNTRQGALEFEAMLRGKLARGEPLDAPPPKNLTFAAFALDWFERYVRVNNKYSEQVGKQRILRLHLLPMLKNIPLERIGARDIETIKERMLQQGRSRKTVNNALAVLSKCLRTAQEWGELASVPRVRFLKVVSERTDFLSEEESHRLLSDVEEPQWHLLVQVALRCGLRLCELLGLRWENIDLQAQRICVTQTQVLNRPETPKNHRIRYVPIPSRLSEELRQHAQFSGLVCARPDGSPMTHSQAIRALERMLRRTGVRRVGWHTLRHTYASHLVMKGVPLTTVMTLLGHSDIRMTLRYAHLAPDYLRGAVEVLEASSEVLNASWATGGQHPSTAAVDVRTENTNAAVVSGKKGFLNTVLVSG